MGGLSTEGLPDMIISSANGTFADEVERKVFSELDEKLRILLETVVPTNVVSLPLKQVNNTIYATAVDQDRYLANTRMYLAISADSSEENIIRRVPQLVKRV